MTSAHPDTPLRRVACNLLWCPDGLRKHPLVTLNATGEVVELTFCAEPDHLAATEFYAGLMILDFPKEGAELFSRWMAAPEEASLDERIRTITPAPQGSVVVISGIEYKPPALTPHSSLRIL